MAAPPIVQRECGLAQRHPVVPRTDDESPVGRGGRLDGEVIDRRRQR